MLLSDIDIKKNIKNGQIKLDPFVSGLIQPASIDVCLDKTFCVFNNYQYSEIDPNVEQKDLTRNVEVPEGEAFILHPGEFALASTFEYVTLGDKVAARFEGKSSLGRLALATHITAGFIDPGFSGHVTLELANMNTLPIKLYPGMKIGQLAFFEMSSAVENPYGSSKNGSHYQGQRGPTPSKTYENFYIADVYEKGNE
ncbi:MAG: dCTP deaminase [Candidatus Ancillula sp.]|jgi:dCTP deaminase|nr:dCTP deaminase [Candidatus Ancillula sp.]